MAKKSATKKAPKKAVKKTAKKQKLKYSLIFLTWDEIEGLKHVFKGIPLKEFDEVFAVDGGSTDGTLEFYKKNKIKVVTQKSKGRGEAFRIAVKEAKGDVLVFYSPDGNEDPKDLVKFRPYFEDGYDMVIASRMMKGAHNEEDEQFFRPRKLANNIFNLISNLAFRRQGKYVTDSINGYRAITKKAFKKLSPDGPGFTIEYQTTMRAFKYKMKIAEFPTHEFARVGGESRAKSIPTGIKFIKIFLKELFRKD